MTGGITVISGPSGVGKGTVVSLLHEHHPEVWVSVSATTRPARPGEIDGVHYCFLTPEKFDDLIRSGGFLEWAVVHGHDRYGTLVAPVKQAAAQGRPVLLEIDLQGARQVRARLPGARFVFLAPPDWPTLIERLSGRSTETPEQVQRRLETARAELAAAQEFDSIIVNDELGRTVAELVSLMGLTDETREG